jgi:P27 family predicted phage terminase small subunit
MMARPSKPAIMHVLEGKSKKSSAELDRRLSAEESLQFKADNIATPTWLREDARPYFDALTQEFEGMDLLRNVDVNALALYCDALLDYVTFTAIIEREGVMTEHTNKAGAENSVPHPLLSKKKQAFDQMSKLMSEFGLTPSARTKLAMSIPKAVEEDSPFGSRL